MKNNRIRNLIYMLLDDPYASFIDNLSYCNVSMGVTPKSDFLNIVLFASIVNNSDKRYHLAAGVTANSVFEKLTGSEWYSFFSLFNMRCKVATYKGSKCLNVLDNEDRIKTIVFIGNSDIEALDKFSYRGFDSFISFDSEYMSADFYRKLRFNNTMESDFSLLVCRDVLKNTMVRYNDHCSRKGIKVSESLKLDCLVTNIADFSQAEGVDINTRNAIINFFKKQ